MKRLMVLILVLFSWGCEKRLDELNEDPNVPEKVAPRFLLSNVLWETADQNSRQGWTAGNLIAQHTANLEFLPADRYQLGTNKAYWDHLYHSLLDLKKMRNAEGSNEAFEAVGKVLKAWIASQLTDLWTRVPYSEAMNAEEGEFGPSYDSQEEIYMGEEGVLDLLKEAVDILKSTDKNIQGDVLYNGDKDRWIRFANALRVRYLVRVSNRVDVSSELQDIVSQGRLMRGNEDNAALPYLSTSPNQWFLYNERVGRYSDVRMSTTIDSVLDTLSDPRVEVLFKPIDTTSSMDSNYKGIPNGLSRESQTGYDLDRVSLIGSRYRDRPDGANSLYMLYSEQEFALAEAAHKGLITGSATTFYQNGIEASFEYYGVTMPTGFLSDPDVVLDGTNDLERIMTQKWLSLFLNGHEAWFNIRRTGFPDLPIPKDNLNGDRYPRRYLYPESEQAVNGENYSEASSDIGGDTYNSKGWWEK